MDSYVVAVKRKMRAKVPADWAKQVAEISGVSLSGETNPARIQIDATPQAIEEVKQRFDYCHVEPVIEYHRT